MPPVQARANACAADQVAVVGAAEQAGPLPHADAGQGDGRDEGRDEPGGAGHEQEAQPSQSSTPKTRWSPDQTSQATSFRSGSYSIRSSPAPPVAQ